MLSPLQRAQKDGYVNITGNEGKRTIEYITVGIMLWWKLVMI